MPRPPRLKPNELAPGWPHVKSGDQVGEVARLLALNLASAIGKRNVVDVASTTGVDDMTIHSILNGRSWPDIATLAKLELGLGADLWPGRPPQ